MSVRVTQYRTGGWEVDIRVVLPDGTRQRERRKLSLSSRSGARRWAEARAGLRCGEIIALEWSNVDLGKRQLCVQRSDWRGHVTAPKGGRLRYVPLATRLATALHEHRHLRSPRVICRCDGSPLTQDMVANHIRRAAKRAQLATSSVHRLRHTFCSHLAMRGAPARAIQELAGHQDLMTTQRYMHLSAAAIEGAIRLLDRPVGGEIGETGHAG